MKDLFDLLTKFIVWLRPHGITSSLLADLVELKGSEG